MRLTNYLIEEDKEITQKALDQLEIYADKLFKAVGIDIEFTTHFLQRVNDKRNKKQINMIELMRLFRKSRKIHGKKIVKLGADAEAVIKDMITDINMPFVLKWDEKSQELDLIAKTIMRKKDFKTSNIKLTLEKKSVKQVSAGVCLTDGNEFLIIHPTNKSFWELPKGLIEPDEKPQWAAARELYEETGVKINAGKLKFFKKFKLHKTKNVILYIYKTELPNISTMKCSSFMKGGVPETDNWMYITFDEIKEYVRPEMHDVLNKIGKLYEEI